MGVGRKARRSGKTGHGTGKTVWGILVFQTARMALLVALVSILAFVLLSVSPVDPLQTNVGQAALGAMSPEQVERLKGYWGVDLPPAERYLSWAADVLRGDMGTSLLYRRPVAEVIWEKLSNSLWLLASSWLLSGLLGFTLGVLAGRKRGGLCDRLVTGYSLLAASTPAFWTAMVLLMVFAVYFKWFPIGLSVPIGVTAEEIALGDRIRHAVLPAAALSLTGISSVALHTREKMVSIMESDFVLFARARGESETSIVLRHGLRNVLIPAMTLQFASISEIIGGSVLVEQVFSYPGLGQAAVTAGLGNDVPLLLGITVVTAVLAASGNLAASVLYGIVDPRIRKGAARGAVWRREKTGRGWGTAAFFPWYCLGRRSCFCSWWPFWGTYGRMRRRSRIFPGRTFRPVPDICSALTGWGGICLSVLWRAFP